MDQDLLGIDAAPAVIGGGRIMAVKGSINAIRFREKYMQNLENSVNMVNDTTRHAFNFSKFIFLRELNNLQLILLKA